MCEPLRLLYVGRVSVEKNLPLLVDAFRQLCRQRNDTALIVAGDGPYLQEMKKKLAGTPAYFLGYRNDKQLGPLYAGSDLFVFPRGTDTLGQVVMEAQASGLPVIVSNEGGPKEMMEDCVTGMMLPATDARRWASMIDCCSPTKRAAGAWRTTLRFGPPITPWNKRLTRSGRITWRSSSRPR